MNEVVLFFDLFDTLIKVDRGYLERYFDSEIDLLGDKGILKNSKMTIGEIVSKYPESLVKYSLEEMVNYYDNVMSDSIINVEKDILDMLASLKKLGYKLCIISDAAYVDIKDFKLSPLAKYFDNTIFSCEHGFTKPDKKIYEIAMEVMGSPDKMVFVGDGGHDELVGAKEAGMKTIKVDWFKKRELFDSVDCIVRDSKELIKFVNDLWK